MLYTIKDKNVTVTVSSLGAELKSFKINDKEFMHDANPKYWGRTAPYLFPNIGTIKDKFATINGIKYNFVKHGFLRDKEMLCTEHKENMIKFTLLSDESTLDIYPYEFELSIIYFIENQTLTTRIFVNNKSNKLMPFNFGLHPAFKIPWNESETFEQYKICFSSPITTSLPIVELDTGLINWNKEWTTFNNVQELMLEHEDYRGDALVIDPYPTGPIHLISPSNEEIIIETFGFKTLGIWTPYPNKSPFICIEPWIGCADAPTTNNDFFNKKDLITLNSNEVWSTTYLITIK